MIGLCSVTLLSAGCAMERNPEGQPLPAITFAHLQKIPINVGMLQTMSEAQGISEAFIVSPQQAMHEYIQSRFVAMGVTGKLQAIIERADVKHSYEAATSKVGSYLEVGGLDVYDMSIKIRLEHVGADNQVKQSAVLNAERLVKVSEHASIADRERRQFQAAEAMFHDIDEQVRKIVLDDMRLGVH